MGKNVYYKKWIRIPLLPGCESRSGPDVGCSPSCGSEATAKVLAAERCGTLGEHEWSLGCSVVAREMKFQGNTACLGVSY